MTATKLIIETAFRLHKEKLLSREDLLRILEECVNATALDNRYTDTYGLPSPPHGRRRRVHRAP